MGFKKNSNKICSCVALLLSHSGVACESRSLGFRLSFSKRTNGLHWLHCGHAGIIWAHHLPSRFEPRARSHLPRPPAPPRADFLPCPHSLPGIFRAHGNDSPLGTRADTRAVMPGRAPHATSPSQAAWPRTPRRRSSPPQAACEFVFALRLSLLFALVVICGTVTHAESQEYFVGPPKLG